MATLLNLHGINFANGTTDKLLVNVAGVIRSYNSSTGAWDTITPITFNTTALMDSTNFLNYAFFVNGSNANYSYSQAGAWSTTTNLSDSPIAKYIENYFTRLYLGNITIRGTAYPSRVWFSDLPKNNAITWDHETGSDLAQSIGSAVVTSAGSSFITRNIKVGDPFIIESGSNLGQYIVRTVDSETQITLTTTLAATQSGNNFWVGGNWFDVNTDDGDVIQGFGKNSNELLVFKKLSLHRYNVSTQNLRQVKGVAGTTSPRSIVDLNEYTYYYDSSSSSIRRYDGRTAIIISLGIDDILLGMSSAMRTEVVGWATNGTAVEFYIGDITTRDGETIDKCVVVWDTITETWSTRSLPWIVEQSANWVQSSKLETYVGTSIGKVLKVADGYTYDTYDISFRIKDRAIFPEGKDVLVDFQRIRVLIDNGQGDIHLRYKILYMPKDDGTWTHSEWVDMRGRADSEMVEFVMKDDQTRRGTGIIVEIIQSSGTESFLLEDYIIYYSNSAIR